MFAQFEAKYAAVHAAAAVFNTVKSSVRMFVALAAIGLGGCLQSAPPLIGPDPADPQVRVPAVGYRSATAPYTRMRPTEPAPWTGRSDPPPSKSDKQEQR